MGTIEHLQLPMVYDGEDTEAESKANPGQLCEVPPWRLIRRLGRKAIWTWIQLVDPREKSCPLHMLDFRTPKSTALVRWSRTF